MTDASPIEADLKLIIETLASAFADKVNDPGTGALARATGLPRAAVFFALNLHGLLERPESLDALARRAAIPAERVPAIRKALADAERQTLSS